MAFTLKIRLKKIFKYVSLTGSTTLLAVCLAWGNLPMIGGIVRFDAAVPNSPAVQVPIRNAYQLMQEGLQLYQSGQFAAAVKVWKQAADAFAEAGDKPNGIPSDRINQAMVLSNLKKPLSRAC